MIFNRAASALAMSALGVMLLAACGNVQRHHDPATGAGGGAHGAAAGHQNGFGTGAYVTAAGLAGDEVRPYMDRQRRELTRQLAAERAAREVRLTSLRDGSIRVSFAADASFEVDSATLKPRALMTYSVVAQVLAHYPATVIWVIGHSDAAGSLDDDRQLSERRAQTVASYLVDQGVSPARVREEGRGDAGPLASNATAAGRARNRRVDVIIRPLVSGREPAAYRPPR